MTISLSDETCKLIEERMKLGGFESPDETVRFALETMHEIKGVSIEELDPETQSAIEEAEAQEERGEARPWEEVRDELRAQYLKRDNR